MGQHVYVCIDLKSFYASVECVQRGLDPMTTNLVVADPERSEQTICLAVSPSMKRLGIKNRCRVFQIPKGITYIMAPPRMKLYLNYSADVYGIYLKYIAKEDIHVYSIDEVFLDVTQYLSLYQLTASELAVKIMEDIKENIGITATAGIGTNLYLAKVALDIMAKHSFDNIGCLDEESYQKNLWDHQPLTDFWRIGTGIEKRLQHVGILTMGDLAHADEKMLYRLFGVDAELLIDHAWGRESTMMEDIKSYKPKSNSLSSSQVLPRNYSYGEGKLIVKEMADSLCVDLAEKGLAASSISLNVGYSNELGISPAVGTASLEQQSNSYQQIIPSILALYERIVQREKPIRRVRMTCNSVVEDAWRQYRLFTEEAAVEKERKMQKAVLSIRQRFGKNAIVRGMDLQKAGTAIERNKQIGGHKSGE